MSFKYKVSIVTVRHLSSPASYLVHLGLHFTTMHNIFKEHTELSLRLYLKVCRCTTDELFFFCLFFNGLLHCNVKTYTVFTIKLKPQIRSLEEENNHFLDHWDILISITFWFHDFLSPIYTASSFCLWTDFMACVLLWNAQRHTGVTFSSATIAPLFSLET